MSRIRIVSVICLLFVVAAIVPTAQAQSATPKAIIAGSSALWQSMALAAYNWETGDANGGSCIAGFVAPCYHYTSSTFQVTDTRPTIIGGSSKIDVNSIWIVWDSHTTTAGLAPNVVAYIKVDSVVGDRCYFGHPRCNLEVQGGGAFPNPSNLITVWPDGSSDVAAASIPANVKSLFTSGSLKVSAAATDVRAEDGEFAMCRANSALPGGTTNDTMQGLGYNPNNTAGFCPTTNDLAHLVATVNGGDITDNNSGTAHILAFNVNGSDPFSGQPIPAATTVPAGAAPIVFITHSLVSGSPLDGVTGVTDQQLKNLLNSTSTGCAGPTVGGTAGAVDVFLREPLSGTFNTVEYNVFAYPDFSGTSQEAGVNPANSGYDPLSTTCQRGTGKEIRGIGTSHVIDKGTVLDTTNDSIAYAFFSYGNVKAASDSSCGGNNCHYLTLNGIDPIFHKHWNTGDPTPAGDPGQPYGFYGEIPSAADTPCTALPCREDQIWTGRLSFPNLRSGQYSAWSVLRLISDGTPLTTVKNLVRASQTYAAINTPDFVPVVAVTASGSFPGDPGLQLLRSHYQQYDNSGALIGLGPIDDSATGDRGGDVGGCIEHFTPGTTGYKTADTVTGLIHTAVGNECSFAPTSH